MLRVFDVKVILSHAVMKKICDKMYIHLTLSRVHIINEANTAGETFLG